MSVGQGADLHMTQLMPLALTTLSLAAVNPDWFYVPGFTFLVTAHSGSPGHSPGGRKTVVVVVIVFCTKGVKIHCFNLVLTGSCRML